MARALPISEVKAHLPELVVAVQEREEEIVVTRKGHPAAVIINVEEYARLRETLDVLGDPALLAEVKAGRTYFRRGGKGIPVDEVVPGKRTEKKPKRRRP
ncbi:MAG TPA: type II toxin-antitoxin system Phd/YefM family antitoxin [Polyangiaceae bacterium]|jgi:prevent-host-death family protein